MKNRWLAAVLAAVLLCSAPAYAEGPEETDGGHFTGEVLPDETDGTGDPKISYDQLMPRDYVIVKDALTTEEPLGLPAGGRVDDSYFDDAVFIGDSVSEKLNMYVAKVRKTGGPVLGKANFLTAVSFGSRNALKPVSSGSLHPAYNGKKMLLEDAIAAMGAKKIYIMFGMNDVQVSGIEKSLENMKELLRRIHKKNPDAIFFIESATPRCGSGNPTTKDLFCYDLALYEMCAELGEGVYFVDVAYALRDAKGDLYKDCCADTGSMALHLNEKGCKVWLEYLYTHTLPEEMLQRSK